MEDSGSTQSTADTDSGGVSAGVSEAEEAALKLEGLRDDEACCKAQIAAAKLQRGPLVTDTLKNAEELLRTIQHDIRMANRFRSGLRSCRKLNGMR